MKRSIINNINTSESVRKINKLTEGEEQMTSKGIIVGMLAAAGIVLCGCTATWTPGAGVAVEPAAVAPVGGVVVAPAPVVVGPVFHDHPDFYRPGPVVVHRGPVAPVVHRPAVVRRRLHAPTKKHN